MSEELWYNDPKTFWNFRAIFHADGLDYVPDRGGFKEKNEDRLEFVSSIINSSDFRDWVKVQTPQSGDIFQYDSGTMHFRATNNTSYGYTYMYAWED